MRVLFIGNSHTYYNDLPERFRQICVSEGVPVEVTMLAHGGKGLDFHRNEPEVRFNILYGNYDWVVLQHLAHPFDNEPLMFEAAKEIDRYVQQTCAKKLLYMTWSEQENPQGQERMTNAYRRLGRELGATVAPVGVAWWECQRQYPDIGLFDTDRRHATPLGSSLAACVIYEAMFRPEKAVCCRTVGTEIAQLAHAVIQSWK